MIMWVVLLVGVFCTTALGYPNAAPWEDPVPLFRSGRINDGEWKCPGSLKGNLNCGEGQFKCKCPGDGREAWYHIGCCYQFPWCGKICNEDKNCARFKHCKTCRSGQGEHDKNNNCETCHPGFTGGDCTQDINECKTANGGCQHKCQNTFGSYNCDCNDGYRLKADKHACEKLSCGAPKTDSKVSAKATDNWMFDSHALYSCNENNLKLIGPTVNRCAGDGPRTFWENQTPPTCLDTCSGVKERVKCGSSRTSRTRCEQMGCCYDEKAATKCFFNPAYGFLPYYGYSTVLSGSDSPVYSASPDDSYVSCGYKCAGDTKCKAYVLQTVTEQKGIKRKTCYLLNKSRAQLLAEKRFNQVSKGDFYDKFEQSKLSEQSKLHTQHEPEVPEPLEKQYIGCYSDKEGLRDLPTLVWRDEKPIAATFCVSLCRHHNYKVAAVQDGTDCYCGNDFVRLYNKSKDCDRKCPDDESLECGGYGSNSIYSVSQEERYQGCYKDSKNPNDESRGLPVFLWGANQMRPAEDCIKECGRRGHQYAGVKDGGTCHCGDEPFKYGQAKEGDCDVSCPKARHQNCGGQVVNAVYRTAKPHALSSLDQDYEAIRLYDETVNGISTLTFSAFPDARHVVTKKLVIHSDTKVLTPSDVTSCDLKCYEKCGNPSNKIYKKSEVTLRYFYATIGDVIRDAGDDAKQVNVHAQTLLVDKSVELPFSLYLHTRELIVDRAKANYIRVEATAPDLKLNILEERYTDSDPDLLHEKQSLTCARILMGTQDRKEVNLGWSIVSSLSTRVAKGNGARAFTSSVRSFAAENAGLARYDLHFVPLVSKAYMRNVLGVFENQIAVYEREFEKIQDESNSVKQVVEYAKKMQSIFKDTDIAEAQREVQTALGAVKRTNGTYHNFKNHYKRAKDDLLRGKGKFEEGLKLVRGWDIAENVINFVTSTTKALSGIILKNATVSDKAINGTLAVAEGIAGLIENIANVNQVIRDFGEIADDVYAQLEDLETSIDDVGWMDIVEIAAQMEVNVVRWKNFKRQGLTLLTGEIESVPIAFSETSNAFQWIPPGCLEYRRLFLNVCNWGQSVTKSTIERAEMTRRSAHKRATYDQKMDQYDQVKEAIEDLEWKNSDRGSLMDAILEQTLEVRQDLNEALLSFCQAYYYETLQACKESHRPKFGGSMTELRLKISSAIKDSILDGEVPSTVLRSVIIQDLDSDPDCMDASQCPINYFRRTGTLQYTIGPHHERFVDMDSYRVAEVEVDVRGARPSRDQQDLLLNIQTSGEFQGRSKGMVRNFITRGVQRLFERNIISGEIGTPGRVAEEYMNSVSHVTPYATWIIEVVPFRSGEIDLSKVHSIVLTMHGGAIDNEVLDNH